MSRDRGIGDEDGRARAIVDGNRDRRWFKWPLRKGGSVRQHCRLAGYAYRRTAGMPGWTVSFGLGRSHDDRGLDGLLRSGLELNEALVSRGRFPGHEEGYRAYDQQCQNSEHLRDPPLLSSCRPKRDSLA